MSVDVEAFFVYGLPAYAFRGFNLKKSQALFFPFVILPIVISRIWKIFFYQIGMK
jgi:hypothetical protein